MANGKRKRIAALVPNVLGFSPGQRVRIELWANALEAEGWEIEFFPFEDEALHEVLYSGGNSIKKAAGLVRCYKNQFDVIKLRLSADIIFIFREAALIGPAILERVAFRHRIPIVFDIDDPVFLPYKSPTNSWASLLKFSKKTHTLFRLSSHVTAINNLIGDYARRYNPNVTVIPNCIDTNRYFPRSDIKEKDDGLPVKLVWIGSQSTMQNLVEIAEPLRKIQEEYKAPVLVIGSGSSNLKLDQLEAREWSAESEVADLQEGEIGLLPINDLPWNKWKFFFKAIQYMAVGIPVVARRMGSNAEIIEDGINGFLVETDREWYDKLSILIKDAGLRQRMGLAARQTIVDKFSFERQMPRVVSVFEMVRDQGRHSK